MLIACLFQSAIQHCRTELASQALRHCPGPTFLTALASGSLLLFIAASTAVGLPDEAKPFGAMLKHT
jgi:hypothetical protein